MSLKLPPVVQVVEAVPESSELSIQVPLSGTPNLTLRLPIPWLSPCMATAVGV